MKKLHFWISNYFGFSYREARGFIITIILVLIVAVSPTIYKTLLPQRPFSITLQTEIDSLAPLVSNSRNKYFTAAKPNESINVIKYAPFDPNTAQIETLTAMGLDTKLAQRIINYRDKGGKFYEKTDLKKIYGLSDEKYQALYPYIEITARKIPQQAAILPEKKQPQPKETLINTFDLNKADTTVLKSFKGIGSKLSQRIITFREKLGGFIAVDQLFEVYGLDSAIVLAILQKAVIAQDYKPMKIEINKVEQDQLKMHPYVSAKMASLIVNYRSQHGPYKSALELKNIKASGMDIEKIIPYLAF